MSKFQITLVAVLVSLACLGGALYYQRVTTKGRYNSTTKFRILQRSVPDLFSTVPADGKKTEGNWLDNQIKLLSSPTILTRVVKVLNLDTEWEMTPEMALARVQERVEVAVERSSDIISVTAGGDSRASAAALANTVRKEYDEMRREMERERFRRLTETVEAQIKLQADLVEKNRVEKEALQKKHGLAAAAEKGPPEYNSGKQRYDSSMMLLNTIRKQWARQKEEEEGVTATRTMVEVLEEAR